jgi:UPF0176 protein
MVASFYRFVPMPDYREKREEIKAIAVRHRIMGTVLLAPEGINSTICGSPSDVSRFFLELAGDARLADFEMRVSYCELPPFGRLKVRLKKEIVRMKVENIDPVHEVGEYVQPSDWNALISSPDVVVIDVRNDYETEQGTFRGAIDPKTEFFSDFPAFVSENLTDKSKVIATFCTGGIRCEKATAYLRRLGFENVKHLKGGILNYLEQIPPEESLWEGKCFVFDDRGAVDGDLQPSNQESTLDAPWPRRRAVE